MTGKDVEEKELLPIAGGSKDWYNHCDKLFGALKTKQFHAGHTVQGTEVCTPVIPSALLAVASMWKPSTHPE